MDLHGHSAQRVNDLRAHLVELRNAFDLDHQRPMRSHGTGLGTNGGGNHRFVEKGKGNRGTTRGCGDLRAPSTRRPRRPYFFSSFFLGFSSCTFMPSFSVRVITPKLPLTTSSPSFSPDLISMW